MGCNRILWDRAGASVEDGFVTKMESFEKTWC